MLSNLKNLIDHTAQVVTINDESGESLLTLKDYLQVFIEEGVFVITDHEGSLMQFTFDVECAANWINRFTRRDFYVKRIIE